MAPINENQSASNSSINVQWNGCVPANPFDSYGTHPYTYTYGTSTRNLFPMDHQCPACKTCTDEHVFGGLHWTGAEAVVLITCLSCQANIKIDPIEGGYVAFATREMCLSITQRRLNGEYIPPDDWELLDWLNARLLEEAECIKDALALLGTVRRAPTSPP